MADTIVITTNASQATDVTIRDMGIIIANSGGSETFTDIGNLSDAKLSEDLRTLATDDAFGAGSSTLILNDGTNNIDQDEIEIFLESLGDSQNTYWGVLAADPGTTPNNGDTYFNSSLNMMMLYDSTRSKWLSSETITLMFGKNNNTGAGAYYRGIGNLPLGQAGDIIGYPAIFNGTVVTLAYTRGDTDAATFEVTADGSAIATLASSATAGSSTSLDGDFSQDEIIAFRNEAGGNITSDVAAFVRIKWRAT